MIFCINTVGTLRGVRAYVATHPYLPADVSTFITSCIDQLDPSYNGVEVDAHGHGGAISGIKITPKVFLLDPVEPPKASEPVVEPPAFVEPSPDVTDGNPPFVFPGKPEASNPAV